MRCLSNRASPLLPAQWSVGPGAETAALCNGLGPGRLKFQEKDWVRYSTLHGGVGGDCGGWRSWVGETLAPCTAVLICVRSDAEPPLPLFEHVARVGAHCCVCVQICVHKDHTPHEDALAAWFRAGAEDAVYLPPGTNLGLHVLQGASARRAARGAADASATEKVKLELDGARRLAGAARASLSRQLWAFAARTFPDLPEENSELAEGGGWSDEVAFTARLGGGGGGEVFLGEAADGAPLAVKVLYKDQHLRRAAQIASFVAELVVLQNLPPHPHVAAFRGCFHGPRALHLHMPYYGQKNLFSWLRQIQARGPGVEGETYCREALAAVAHLHAHWVAHRDLKAENFVVADLPPRGLTLVDFGLSASLACGRQKFWSSAGTHPYTPTEVLSPPAEGYDPLLSDVWSLGCLFHELLHGGGALERALGWRSLPLATRIFAEVPTLEDRVAAWADADAVAEPTPERRVLLRAVGLMVRREPSQRLRADSVVGLFRQPPLPPARLPAICGRQGPREITPRDPSRPESGAR